MMCFYRPWSRLQHFSGEQSTITDPEQTAYKLGEGQVFLDVKAGLHMYYFIEQNRKDGYNAKK